ncbi:MAG: monovalent cation/H+ antiporter complex subunit F [Cellulomonas sp.]|nr:monovalent cation/H+ antiporter complex subunit F [Cellulomonas sp.]
MIVVVWVCAVLILTGAALAIVRAERGPSMLDRTIALDVVLTTLIAAVALYAAAERRADVVPVLVVLSLVGFVGSVTIARFAAVEPEGEGRVLTRAEAAAQAAELEAAEQDRLDAAGAPTDLPSTGTTLAPPDDETGGPSPQEVR